MSLLRLLDFRWSRLPNINDDTMNEVMTNYANAVSAGRIPQANYHHLTTLSFPDESLLRNDEELTLPYITNAANRYEPTPLVNDPAVTANAYRDSLEETSFYLLSPASVGGASRDFRDPRKPVRGNIHDSQEDMKTILPLAGCTSINYVTTLRRDPQGAPIEHIRILRKTVLLTTDGTSRQYERLYLSTIADWDAFCPTCDVIKLMEHLMMGTSDRAVLHIDAALRCQGRSLSAPEKWKSPRRPQYGAVIGAVAKNVNFVSLEAEDRACPLCFCGFDEPEHDAVALHCNEKHLLCRSCLVQCCQAEAVKTRCPFCRSPVFTDEKTVEWLKTGALGKTYEADPQYNDWENHERMAADLDKYHADSNRSLLKINSRVLKDAWNVLLRWEESEPIGSTPIYFNPARFAGREVVTRAFEVMVDRLDGTEFPMHMVFENIMRALREAIADPSAKGLSLMPGYEACIRRRVSRTLNFARVRRCKCTQRRYHFHGLRKYYNEDFLSQGFCRSQ